MLNYPFSERLILELKKYCHYTKGSESIAADGAKYRYDRYILKYNSAADWLVILFTKAAEENGNKYAKQFVYNNCSFYFDRPAFNGVPNGKISFTELIII